MIRKVFIAMMVVLMVSSVAAAMELEDVKVPETFEAGDQLLVLNGAGVRNVFLNDVYVSGLWLENPSTDGNAIAAADEPMAIRIHVLNDFFASSKNISNAFTKGFRYALPKGDLTPVKEELDRQFSEKLPGFEVKTWTEMSHWYRKVKSMFDVIFIFLFIIVFVIVITSVINTMKPFVAVRGPVRAMMAVVPCIPT